MQLCWQDSQQISSSFFPEDRQKPAVVSQDNAFLCALHRVESKVLPGICLTNTQNSRMRIQVEGHDTEAAWHRQFVKNLILGVRSASAGLLKQGSPQRWTTYLLPEASLLFYEEAQRLLIRKGILVWEVDKLLLQKVMLWIFKGTQLHHFHCPLHDIKVKHTETYISLYRFSPGLVFFSLLFLHTEFKWGIKGLFLYPCGNNKKADFLPTTLNIYLKVSYSHRTSTQSKAKEKT